MFVAASAAISDGTRVAAVGVAAAALPLGVDLDGVLSEALRIVWSNRLPAWIACAFASSASLLLLADVGVATGVARAFRRVGVAVKLAANALLTTSDGPDSACAGAFDTD